MLLEISLNLTTRQFSRCNSISTSLALPIAGLLNGLYCLIFQWCLILVPKKSMLCSGAKIDFKKQTFYRLVNTGLTNIYGIGYRSDRQLLPLVLQIMSLICFSLPAISIEFHQKVFIHIISVAVPITQICLSGSCYSTMALTVERLD